MNRQQEAFFGMTLKVKNFGVQQAGDLAIINAIPPLFTDLNLFITDLITADAGSSADLTGYTINKDNKRNALESIALKVSNGLAAHGAVTNDTELQKRADFNTSFWDTCSEEKLITESTILINLADTSNTVLMNGLADLGVSAADVTALATASTAFINVVSNPSLAIDKRKEDTARIEKILDAMRTFFNTKMDVILRVFESSNPTLFALYKSARAIDLNGSQQNPTVTLDIEPNSIMSLYELVSYDPNILFTIRNTSDNTNVYASLSIDATTEGPNPLLIPFGDTRQRLADNLAPDGKFLVINNPNPSAVVVKLWVEA